MTDRYHEFYTEQDAMIRDLAREKDLPHGVNPDVVHSESDRFGRGSEERCRLAWEWRQKLIAELDQRPDWVAEWRAEQDLNRRIEALCEARELAFMPHETTPWNAPDELPDDWDLAGDKSLPKAVKLRRKLIAELEGGR
jgi:hypothetical protein